MREIFEQTQFRKDIKKVKRSGRYRVEDLLEIARRLASGEALDPKRLILVRTGTHGEIFG